ncbi:MAG: peptidoglycan-binding protein [Candidatus Omnitrophica bacterium]|nr:peptidoglycan-binding protein [Candidatus Omnitrophota bacterium]
MRGMVFMVLFSLCCLSGCATTKMNPALEERLQGIETRLSTLEHRQVSSEEKVWGLESTVQQSRVQRQQAAKYAAGSSATLTKKNIQVALKNAGYYNGPLDGVIGSKTTDAIKKFQRDNNLTADGNVGRKTWEKLKKYLD